MEGVNLFKVHCTHTSMEISHWNPLISLINQKFKNKLKRWSILLIIEEMQIKATISYHLNLVRMTIINDKKKNKISVGKDVEKRKCFGSYKNINWYTYYGKQYESSSK
jgi:hypothetical protein